MNLPRLLLALVLAALLPAAGFAAEKPAAPERNCGCSCCTGLPVCCCYPSSDETLASPCPPDSGQSSLHRGPDGTVYLTWSGPGVRAGERGLWFATLAPDATAWSEPRAIVSTPLLMENWADFATLTVATDGILWAQWFQRPPEADAHGYSGWHARSSDGGVSWSNPAPLGHEFVSMIPFSGGRVLVAWLESTRHHTAHGHQPAAGAHDHSASGMQLKSRLLAPDGTSLRDWVVDSDVCNCCQTSLAPLPGDRAALVYRGHQPDETRDHGVALFDGSDWSVPRPLHTDGWKIAGCPVNGPAADAVDETVAVTWFTAAGGIPRVQARVSGDGGRSFGSVRVIDLGRPLGRLDLVSLADGSAVISWLEAPADGHEAGLFVRRIFPDGALSAPLRIAATASIRASGFPHLAARPGPDFPVVISWTDAMPAEPANPRSPAATRVLTSSFPGASLAREPAPAAATPVATDSVAPGTISASP